MKFQAIYHGQSIVFTDLHSAIEGAKELQLKFFYPVKDTFSFEPVEKVYIQENGSWVLKNVSDMKCTCGCHL